MIDGVLLKLLAALLSTDSTLLQSPVLAPLLWLGGVQKETGLFEFLFPPEFSAEHNIIYT